MRAGLLALGAALLVASCRSAPDAAPGEAELRAYRQALRDGTASSSAADAVVRAELAGIGNPQQRAAAGRAAARRHHELARAAADAEEALAREEVAHRLLAATCASCARDQIPILLHLAQLHAQRGDRAGLARCAERMRYAETPVLDARRLSDWPLLRSLGELYEILGDFARAAQIERSLLEAKLQVLDAAHPQVAASRARIAELELRSLEPPSRGEAPADPAW